MSGIARLEAILLRYIFDPSNAKTLSLIADEMQVQAPGPYQLRWQFDTDGHVLGVELIFADPEQETLWMLQHL